MAAPVIVADGDKGGVGKSFTMRSVAHCQRSWGMDCVGIDGDSRNAHLERYYGSTMPVSRPYLREEKGWNEMIDLIHATSSDRPILVDLPAGIGDAVKRWGPKFGAALDKMQRRLIRLWVLDEEDDVIQLLRLSSGVFPFGPSTVVVMNGRFGDREAFELWNGSKTRRDLLAAGGTETYLPRLAPAAREKIRNARCPFADAAEKANFTLSEAIDLEIWLSSIEHTFAPLRKLLESVR